MAATAGGAERTLAWFDRFRRLVVRYERGADVHGALLAFAALIAFHIFQK